MLSSFFNYKKLKTILKNKAKINMEISCREVMYFNYKIP